MSEQKMTNDALADVVRRASDFFREEGYISYVDELEQAAAALRARAVPEGYAPVPKLILARMKRLVDDAEKLASEGMCVGGPTVRVDISDIKSMLLAASKAATGGAT